MDTVLWLIQETGCVLLHAIFNDGIISVFRVQPINYNII